MARMKHKEPRSNQQSKTKQGPADKAQPQLDQFQREQTESWSHDMRYLAEDMPLTVEDAMQGNVVTEGDGGSGATGGDLTGERTPGGMSEDLTTGIAGGGRYGGPTGGEGWTDVSDVPSVARGGKVRGYHGYSSNQTDAELARKVAIENTIHLINDQGH